MRDVVQTHHLMIMVVDLVYHSTRPTLFLQPEISLPLLHTKNTAPCLPSYDAFLLSLLLPQTLSNNCSLVLCMIPLSQI